MDPVVQVGKSGLNEAALEHISRILRQRKTVRVKLLRSFLESSSPAEAERALLERTGARSRRTGFVITLDSRQPRRRG